MEKWITQRRKKWMITRQQEYFQIAFWDKYGYFPLILYQNLITDCNILEWETLSINFMFSVTLKSTGLARTLEGFLTKHDFVISYVGHLEKDCFTVMQIFKCWHISSHTILKKCSLTSPISSEKSFKYWEAVKSTVADISFPKF